MFTVSGTINYLLKAPLLPFLPALMNLPAAIAELVVADAVVRKIGHDICGSCLRYVTQGFLCQKRLM